MKTVSITEFRKHMSSLFSEIERGESIIVSRYGRPIAEIIPFSEKEYEVPSWKKPGIKLEVEGAALSEAILEERGNN